MLMELIKTAMTYLLGKSAASIAAVLICLVIAGSLLGNSFVTGRMTVAAANKTWLPRDLSVVGRIGRKHREIPRPNEESASNKTVARDAPMQVNIALPLSNP